MADIERIVSNLISDYGLKDRGQYMRGGRCPACNKKSLFIERDKPFNLKCGRENKCQGGRPWQMKTSELYPECFKSLEEEHPPTPANPNATADVYLRRRGFDISKLKGWYEQAQKIEYKAVPARQATETVRFYLDAEKTRYWEKYIRPIEMEDGIKLSNLGGARKPDGSIFKESWWENPTGNDYREGKKVFLVEGIFDAISLIQSGKQANALLSCNNFPSQDIEPYLGKGVHWVVALDNDDAGRRYAIRWYKKLIDMDEKASICLAPTKSKEDWNDVFKKNKKPSDKSGWIPDYVFEDWFYEGDLLTAESPKEKAWTIFGKYGEYKKAITFEFDQKIYWAKYNEKEEGETLQISRICNSYPEFLYFQKDIITRESLYFVRVTRKGNNRVYKEEFRSSHISSAQKFEEQLLDAGPGMHFTGNKPQLSRFLDDFWFNDPNPPEISSVNFLGYAKEFKAWIFTDQCVHNGKMHSVNAEDYFDLGDGQQVKTSYRVEPITLSENNKPELWYDHFKTAYGMNGLGALAFWFGSFFAEQMREELESFPFLELSGQPGTGKTKLLEFLWKLTGRPDYEGIDLAKATHAGRWRTFSQLGNLPTVLIEGDRNSERGHQSQQFDMNEAKPLYNGRGMRVIGAKTGGNETIMPPFRSALVVAQNEQVDADQAVMERICHFHFDKSGHSAAGERAVNALINLEMGDINGFLTESAKQEDKVMERVKHHYRKYMAKFDAVEIGDAKKKLKNRRIRHNFSQLMACAEAMSDLGLVMIPRADIDALYAHMVERAWKRHVAIRSDHPMIEEFFEIYDYLESTGKSGRPAVNHHKSPGFIAINFPQFNNYAIGLNQRIGNQGELKKLLKHAKHYLYRGYKVVDSAITGKKTKCFVFERQGV